MKLTDERSLARSARNVNEAHFLGRDIDKSDARAAIDWIRSRYWQDIPERIRQSAKPDPRWAAIPKSFNLTDDDRRAGPRTITGEPVANASMRMVHSREAARAMLILGDLTGEPVSEAEELCASVRHTADHLEAKGLELFCCGPCTAAVWRLANIGGLGDCEQTLDHLLSALPKHRDAKSGAWRRFPFYFTVLALLELDHPKAATELDYVRPECEKKRKRLKPKDDTAIFRMAVLDRALGSSVS